MIIILAIFFTKAVDLLFYFKKNQTIFTFNITPMKTVIFMLPLYFMKFYFAYKCFGGIEYFPECS